MALSDTAYHITEDEFIQIVDKLPKETFTDFKKWCSFTTMCKILNFKNVWEEINKIKPNDNETNNQKIWKAIDNFFFAIVLLNRYRYYKGKSTSKNFRIYFLCTIFGLRRAKFCCKVVLLHSCRYYKAGYASCDS